VKPTYTPIIELSALYNEKIISDDQFTLICENDNFSFGDNDKTLITVQRIIDELNDQGFGVSKDHKLSKLIMDENGNEIYVDLEA
jgi:hypothetical protein